MTSRQYTQKGVKTPQTSCHFIPHHRRKAKNIGRRICVLSSSKCSSQSHDPGWNPAGDKARQDTPVCVLAHLEPTVAQNKIPSNWAPGGWQDWITDVQASERQTDHERWVRCHSQEQSCYHPSGGFFKGGFQKVCREVVGPRPLPVNSLSLIGRFVDLATLFALHCKADCNVLHGASHFIAASDEITS